MPRFLRWPAILLLVLSSACTTQRYIARVPHMSVPMSSGQAMSSPFEITGGASAVADLKKPRAGDTDTSMEVPGTQLHLSLRFRTTRETYAGILLEQGLSQGSHKLNTGGISIGARDVVGVGGFFGGALALSPELDLGLHAELISWSLPYVELIDGALIDSGREGVSTAGFGLSPSYRQGPVRLFGTFFLRNHPLSTSSVLLDGGISRGPVNFTVAGGVEYAFSPIVSATAIVNQELTGEPVRYGPSLQLAVTGKLGN